MEKGPADRHQAARAAHRLDGPTLRAAWWTLRAARRTKRRLKRRGLDGALELRTPPPLPPEAERGVNAVLRRRNDTCLVRSIVRQAWYASQGEARELIIGVTAPDDPFHAHAWLEGEPAHGDGQFRELLRRPSPTKNT